VIGNSIAVLLLKYIHGFGYVSYFMKMGEGGWGPVQTQLLLVESTFMQTIFTTSAGLFGWKVGPI
jgi:hypothetical protein